LVGGEWVFGPKLAIVHYPLGAMIGPSMEEWPMLDQSEPFPGTQKLPVAMFPGS
jgi:hypothetical protein